VVGNETLEPLIPSEMRIKHATIAGTWYPGDPDELRRTLDVWLADVGAPAAALPRALIVPHAGYQYSGKTAAAAYGRWKRAPHARVVILAPSHRAWFRGAALPGVDAFETPLGRMEVDDATGELAEHPLISIDLDPFQGEHSLEIQLPFLRQVLPDARVVPLLCGQLQAEDYPAFTSALTTLERDDTLIVVSSDFTHYGRQFDYQPFPARDAESVRDNLRALDMGAIEPILDGDLAGFRRYVADTGITACGRTPIAAFLAWMGPRCRGELLAYRTSLDLTGDYHHSVSYAAIAFHQRA
jgi:AmmeMemoRadiSam system protein B